MSRSTTTVFLLLVPLASCGGTDSDDVREIEHRVGTPCATSDESDPGFEGYGADVVLIADTAEPDLFCLYNHFQGRLGCPYGQSESDLTLPETDPKRCKTPEGVPVWVEVPPQLALRQAKDTVHLSCRCDGPDPSATYCGCPSGFQCTHLVEDLGTGTTDLAGSYCLKAGTAWSTNAGQGPVCDRSAPPGDPAHCG